MFHMSLRQILIFLAGHGGPLAFVLRELDLISYDLRGDSLRNVISSPMPSRF